MKTYQVYSSGSVWSSARCRFLVRGCLFLAGTYRYYSGTLAVVTHQRIALYNSKEVLREPSWTGIWTNGSGVGMLA